MAEDPVNLKRGLAANLPRFEPVAFPTGSLMATPPALRRMLLNNVDPLALLKRHTSCDWADMSAEDRKANIEAVQCGARIFASYNLNATERVWVITEADRSSTTFLLPSEY